MANTYADYTATSGQTDFAFTFPYLKDTHVIVSIDGTETDVNDTGAGSFTIVTSPSTLVRLDSGATAGANVRVKRNSLGKSNGENDPLVDYNDGSVLTEKDLDDAYLHNFYLSQEAVEGAAGGLSLDSSNQSWDTQNKKIINVSDPTNAKDAANLQWVNTQVSNTVTGSTTAAQKWTFTGDNTTTAFTFSPTINLNEDTAYAVAIDGVMQEPTAAYAIDASTNTITFTSAPPTSSNIVVIARGYSVPVTSGAGTVTSVTAGNGLSGGTITSSGTVSIPTSGGDLNINSGKVGIGGDADSGGYELKVTGDTWATGNTQISGQLGIGTTPISTHRVSIDGDLLIQDTTGDNFPAAVFTGSSGAAVQLNDSSSNGSVFNLSSNVPGASGTEVGQFGVGYIDKDEATRTAVNVTNVSVSGNLATITTDAAHDLVQHEYVILSGFSGSNATTYNATHVVAEVTSTTVFKVYIGVTVGSYSGATATKRKTYTTFSVTRKDTGTGTSTVAYSQFQIYVLPQATSEPTYLPSYALWVDTTNGDNVVKCKLP